MLKKNAVMARITAKERESKKQAMDAKILSIFLEEGWDSVTYDRLAKEFNTRKSSIQNYYSSNIMFATALQGKVFPLVVPLLDFSSYDKFVSSWMSAYQSQDNHVFREVVKMLLDNLFKDGTSPHSRAAVLKLQHLLAEKIGNLDAERAIKLVFGEIIYLKMSL